MSDKWRLGKHRDYPVAITGSGRDKRRLRIYPTATQSAESLVRQLNVEAERVKLSPVLSMSELYGLYEKDRAGKVENHKRILEVGRTLQPIWGHLTVDEITPKEVKRFTDIRRRQGCSDSTIRQELAYITAALNMAKRAKVIPEVPSLEKPPPSRPRERFLERHELVRLLGSAVAPHLQMFIVLAITTAGRPKHILELTWDRVDLRHRIIDLDNPARDRTRKGRARVPINDTAMEHLTLAQRIAETEFVIELDGKPVKSVKNGVKAAARRAGLPDVSQYVLRHTAGVYMARDGVPLEQIAELMGHSSIETTRHHYAKFHPAYLRQASRSLEIRRPEGS